MLLAVCTVIASPAMAQKRAPAEPVRIVTYEYRCTCTWRGYCDSERTLFKTVELEKKPSYQTGCTADKTDRKWLRAQANKSCKANGFELYYSADSASCGWHVEPRTQWVLPQRQRSWMWVYRKRILAHRRARAAWLARKKARMEAQAKVEQ